MGKSRASKDMMMQETEMPMKKMKPKGMPVKKAPKEDMSQYDDLGYMTRIKKKK